MKKEEIVSAIMMKGEGTVELISGNVKGEKETFNVDMTMSARTALNMLYKKQRELLIKTNVKKGEIYKISVMMNGEKITDMEDKNYQDFQETKEKSPASVTPTEKKERVEGDTGERRERQPGDELQTILMDTIARYTSDKAVEAIMPIIREKVIKGFASVIKDAMKKLKENGIIDKRKGWQGLYYLCSKYLDGKIKDE